jgi:putative ABC transport system substrate-binding protein
MTGQSLNITELSSKHVQYLKTIIPGLSRLAVVTNPQNSSHQPILTRISITARNAGVSVLRVIASSPEEIEPAFATMPREQVGAVIVALDAFFTAHRQQITQLAARHRLPSMFGDRLFVEVGGLMSYGQDLVSFYRSAATYVDKILKGTKPSILPIEQPTNYKLVINFKTAKALGIVIPQTLLAQADEVIE